MKRIIVLILSLLLAMTLVACGSSEENDEPVVNNNTEETNETNVMSGDDKDSEKLVSDVVDVSAFGKNEQGIAYKWIVLDVDVDQEKALLLMDGYIDTMYMFTGDETYTWENSQVRDSLNLEPNLDVMFSDDERALILETNVVNKANPKTGVSSGNNTKDYLFILSTEEMEYYFENPEDRVIYDENNSPIGQYLRTSGGEANYFAMIIQDSSGDIDYNGSHGYSGAYAIRPALWISLKKENTSTTVSDPKEETPTTTIPLSSFLGTKTGAFYSVFTSGKMKMEYEIEVEGQMMRMITATKGDQYYMENYEGDVLLSSTLIDGTDMYVIDHTSKMIIKMALQNDLLSIANLIITESDVDMGELEKGTREIDGKTYETESWIMDGEKATMCFDGNKLVYMIGDFDGYESIIKILSFSNDVDDKIFEIPSGYEVLELG